MLFQLLCAALGSRALAHGRHGSPLPGGRADAGGGSRAGTHPGAQPFHPGVPPPLRGSASPPQGSAPSSAQLGGALPCADWFWSAVAVLSPKAVGKMKAGVRGGRLPLCPGPQQGQVWLFRDHPGSFQTCTVCPHSAGHGRCPAGPWCRGAGGGCMMVGDCLALGGRAAARDLGLGHRPLASPL